MAKNGYFRIRLTSSGRFVEIYPPEAGGETVDLNELKNYLTERDYPADMVKLKATVESAKDEVKTAKLDTSKGFAEAECMAVSVSQDGMRATARFYPAAEGGNELSEAEIINDLKFKGIIFGVQEENIRQYLAERNYCTDYIVAEGKPVKQGTDGAVEYLFNTDPTRKPKLNEDGTVNFFDLNILQQCEEGDVLARLTPAVPGEDGQDVYGQFVKPREVNEASFKSGAHTIVSEDGLELRSDVSGNVTLVDDTIFVKDVYEVQDVDTSTGNIKYKGDVKIVGSVTSGFTVKASGSVEVKGVVEGASIEAGEDIIIGRGMNGMGKGELKAGRNIIAKFLENAKVTAGGYVQAEAIIHSEVMAKTNIAVNGKKGNITGGSVRALGMIEAKSVGSEMGVETHVEVGTDPEVRQKIISLEGDMARLRKALEQLSPVLQAYTQRLKRGEQLTEEQLTQMSQINAKYKVLSGALEKETKTHDELVEKVKESEDVQNAVIKVSGYVFPGTVITIINATKEMKTPAQHSRFVREGVDIRIKSLF